MNIIFLLLFCIALIFCVSLNYSILYALVFGVFIFSLFAKYKGIKWKQILILISKGAKTTKNILIVFILIGILTSLWRSCGTIPYIIGYSVNIIKPGIFILMIFLLNALISLLTGTSFGTAATMGVICITMANASGINPAVAGGAMLSGAFFGDRCSPVSTSALLVSEVTGTNLYSNIKAMIKTAIIPFSIVCLIYLVIGLFTTQDNSTSDLISEFSNDFKLSWLTLLPALIIVLFSLLRINVKWTMIASIIVASIIAITLQERTFTEILKTSFFGYTTNNSNIAGMLNGGGILSMIKVSAIVCISASYSELFIVTGMLDFIEKKVKVWAKRIGNYSATLITSLFTSSISCNQVLAIILTNQICRGNYKENKSMAVDLEDSAVVIPPLIPWSIASAVPITTTGSPMLSIVFSFFLILLPLWRVIHK